MSNIDDAEVVILGGGIVGCSIAYHLAREGCTDVMIIDRGSVYTPLGSSGHAPGLIGQLSPSEAMTAAAKYSVELYSKVPEGNPAFSRVGSIEVARDPERLDEYRRKVVRAGELDLRAEILSPGQLRELVPFMDTSGLTGGLFVHGDGVVAAHRAHHGVYELARSLGVRFIEGDVHTLRIAGGRIQGLETSQGVIRCQRLVMAAGIWGREAMRMAGVYVPVIPMQHPYVRTAPLPVLPADAPEAQIPLVRDIDNLVYYRQHGNRMGFGWYLHSPTVANVSEDRTAERPFDVELFGQAPNLSLFPFLNNTKIDHRMNGLFSMTPDGLPLIGTLDHIEDLWLAEAIWFTHAGGLGRAVAELMGGKLQPLDVSAFDVRRFEGANIHDCESAALNLYNRIYDWPTADHPPLRSGE